MIELHGARALDEFYEARGLRVGSPSSWPSRLAPDIVGRLGRELQSTLLRSLPKERGRRALGLLPSWYLYVLTFDRVRLYC